MKTRTFIAAAALSLVAAAPVFAADANQNWEGQDQWQQLNTPAAREARGTVGTAASFEAIEGRINWPQLNAPITKTPRGVVGTSASFNAVEGHTAGRS